jgi:hypothetical protein
MKRKIVCLATVVLSGAIAAAHAGEQIEPNAGSWKTWVIASGRDFRAAPSSPS